MRWVYRLTDSETLRGNIVLIALAAAALLLFGVVYCGCAVDTRGLEATAVTDAPERRPDTMTTDTTMPVDVTAPPAVADAAPLADVSVPDVGAPDVQVPDVQPSLLGLGVHCDTDNVCASGHCSGGYRVCAERMCGSCERGTRDGHCELLPDNSACVSTPDTCEMLPGGDRPCLIIQHMCKAGTCVPDVLDDCCPRQPAGAPRRMCAVHGSSGRCDYVKQ